jgi:CHASE3 domain sensor protein
MECKKMHLVMVVVLVAVMLPTRILSQSQTSSNETQELRKLVEQLRVQMVHMQAEIDQLKATKMETGPQR